MSLSDIFPKYHFLKEAGKLFGDRACRPNGRLRYAPGAEEPPGLAEVDRQVPVPLVLGYGHPALKVFEADAAGEVKAIDGNREVAAFNAVSQVILTCPPELFLQKNVEE